MKSLFLGVAILALAGCAASRQEVVEQLGQQYIGQNVDQMVVSLGPPASTFRMNSGEMSYIWQLTSETNFAAESDRYGIAGRAKIDYDAIGRERQRELAKIICRAVRKEGPGHPRLSPCG